MKTEVHAPDLAKRIELIIQVTGVKETSWRFKLMAKLIALAGKVGGIKSASLKATTIYPGDEE